MHIIKKIWQWIDNYFTLLQLIEILGGTAIMASIMTWLTTFFISLGIVEKIFMGIGLTLLLASAIMWVWSRVKKHSGVRKVKNREWITQNMPYLVELRINLAKANEYVSATAVALAKRKVSYSIIERCNKRYKQMVESKMIKKPFSYANIPDIKTARRISEKTLRKIGKNAKKLIYGMEAIAEIMEKEKIGLALSLRNDNEYKQLLSKVNEQRAVANPKISTAITLYNSASYSGNCCYMFNAYLQNALYKKDKRVEELLPELFRPLDTIRREIDNVLSILLANVEDVIEDSIDYKERIQ